jgi:hypothetical protein
MPVDDRRMDSRNLSHYYRAPMTGNFNLLRSSVASPRQRYSVLLATLLLTILQLAAFSHVIGHAAGDDAGDCEICLSAAHGGKALIAAAPLPPAFQLRLGRLIAVPERQTFSRTPAVYRARGPPAVC